MEYFIDEDLHKDSEQFLMKIDLPHTLELYLCVDVELDNYHIHATDGNQSWRGKYLTTNIKDVAKEANMCVEEVASETRNALTGQHGVTLPNYTYKLIYNSHDDSAVLQWNMKKPGPKNDEIVLGKILLEPCPYDMIVLYSAFLEINSKSKENSELKHTIKQLEKQIADLISKQTAQT